MTGKAYQRRVEQECIMIVHATMIIHADNSDNMIRLFVLILAEQESSESDGVDNVEMEGEGLSIDG